MAFTRTYPLAVANYRPPANPLRTNKATLTDGSANLTNVQASDVAAVTVPGDWYVTITAGLNPLNCGTYRITGAAGTTLNLVSMDGVTPVSPPVGSTGTYTYSLFKNTTPSANDRLPEAILFTVVGAGPLTGITGDGQFFSIPTTAFVAGAIYNLSIKQITSLGGCSGFLLGGANEKGSAIRY